MVREDKRKVFIVDDSPLVRERLINMISEIPTAEVVGQADIAFGTSNTIHKLRPAVVVLDISMPGGSGLHLLEEIKQSDPAPLVIVLTNFADEPYRQKCFQLGADHFLDKSTEFEKVMDIIRL